MRMTGTLRSWNEERGFGFIAPTHGGREIFVHASALPRDGTRPVVGETLSYELGTGRDGKPAAIEVYRTAIGAPEVRRHRPTAPRRARHRFGMALWLLVAVAAAVYVYGRVAGHGYFRTGASPLSVRPSSAQREPTRAVSPRCDGRRYCSQMTSCAEAKFFLRNCPDTQMDGDHDGVPCEQQWCTGLFD